MAAFDKRRRFLVGDKVVLTEDASKQLVSSLLGRWGKSPYTIAKTVFHHDGQLVNVCAAPVVEVDGNNPIINSGWFVHYQPQVTHVEI